MDQLEPAPAGATSPARWRWAGPLVFAVVLAGALPSLPRGVVNWDNVVKLQVGRNLLGGRGMALTDPTPDDEQYVLRGATGTRYAGYPPLAPALQLVTLAASPALGGLREGAGTILVLALLGWALVAWGRAAGVSLEASVIGALLATLGTMLWPMAALGYDVLVEALALALIFRAGTGEAAGGRWALAGLALGAAFATRVGASVLGVSAAVLLLAQRPRGLGPLARRAVVFGLSASPGVALVLWFNHLRFGSPLVYFQDSVLGHVGQLASPWFSRAHLEGMAGLLVSPGKGFFWYAPPLLGVVVAASPLARRYGATAAAWGAQLVASVLVFGAFRYWHGDWAWGPRYLAPLCVAAAPLAWWIVDLLRDRGRAAHLAAGGALVAAIAIQGLPVVGMPVPTHFALTLLPLAAEHRLVTSPVTRPPVPEDNRLLYFELATSPFASLARGIGQRLADPAWQGWMVRALARAGVAPLLAALSTWAVWRRTRETSGPR
jgi:hypothetical protein